LFAAPRRARGFFEALVADNLDVGRCRIGCAAVGCQVRA
jgi:hypothetical protein